MKGPFRVYEYRIPLDRWEWLVLDGGGDGGVAKARNEADANHIARALNHYEKPLAPRVLEWRPELLPIDDAAESRFEKLMATKRASDKKPLAKKGKAKR